MYRRFDEYDCFKHIGGTRKKYRLEEDLLWYVGWYKSPFKLVIPKGFVVDVSAPRFLEWAIDVHNVDLLAAAAVHDYLLEEGEDYAFASAEFRRALKARGRGEFESWIFFASTLLWTEIANS